MKISGSNAVVVAGAQGIGLAYCEALLEKGAKLFMGDILEEKGRQETERLQGRFGTDSIHFSKVDVTNTDQIQNFFQQAVETLGHLDIVVGNAGIIQEFDWIKCIDVNLMGTIRVTQEALKIIGKDKGGKGGVLVHTASAAALRPWESAPVYVATKHGVLGYCRSLAEPAQYEQHGVRVNCVCPRSVDTQMFHSLSANNALCVEKLLENKAKLIATALRPRDVAQALVELVEDDSISGAAMVVLKDTERFCAPFRELTGFLPETPKF